VSDAIYSETEFPVYGKAPGLSSPWDEPVGSGRGARRARRLPSGSQRAAYRDFEAA